MVVLSSMMGGVYYISSRIGEVLRLELEMSLIPVCLTYILMRKV